MIKINFWNGYNKIFMKEYKYNRKDRKDIFKHFFNLLYYILNF